MNNSARLSNIERARSKADVVDDFSKVLDCWTRKFNEFFDGCNNSPSITDPIQPENNTP
jgi:general stress protein 26